MESANHTRTVRAVVQQHELFDRITKLRQETITLVIADKAIAKLFAALLDTKADGVSHAVLRNKFRTRPVDISTGIWSCCASRDALTSASSDGPDQCGKRATFGTVWNCAGYGHSTYEGTEGTRYRS